MPRRLSRLLILEPTPQIYSTGWRDNITSMRPGLLGVKPARRETEAIPCSLTGRFCERFCWRQPTSHRQAGALKHVGTDHYAKIFIGHCQLHPPTVTESFVDEVNLQPGNHLLNAGHHTRAYEMIKGIITGEKVDLLGVMLILNFEPGFTHLNIT